jgi:hypothetical protein
MRCQYYQRDAYETALTHLSRLELEDEATISFRAGLLQNDSGALRSLLILLPCLELSPQTRYDDIHQCHIQSYGLDLLPTIRVAWMTAFTLAATGRHTILAMDAFTRSGIP